MVRQNNLQKIKQSKYLPSKTSGERRPNLSTNSTKGFLVGNPAQLIQIASMTPWNVTNKI
jgi:hypothetical protein